MGDILAKQRRQDITDILTNDDEIRSIFLDKVEEADKILTRDIKKQNEKIDEFMIEQSILNSQFKQLKETTNHNFEIIGKKMTNLIPENFISN